MVQVTHYRDIGKSAMHRVSDCAALKDEPYDFSIELFHKIERSGALRFCGMVKGYLYSKDDSRISDKYRHVMEALPKAGDHFGVVDRIELEEDTEDILLWLKKALGEQFKSAGIDVPNVFVNLEGYPYPPERHMMFQDGLLYVY